MTIYCKCDKSEPEEIKRGVIICLNCNELINPSDISEDAPEPDEDDFSEAPDIVGDDNFQYEQDREVNQVSNEGGRL